VISRMTQQILAPVKYIKPLQGKSKPHLILFNNNLKYVVKFKDNPQGKKLVVNEYVVNCLAQYLTLPVPPFTVVSIPQEFINEHPHFPQHNHLAGLQFASLFIDHCTKLPKAPFHPINTNYSTLNALPVWLYSIIG
jgi:hypothetical protein